MCIRSAGMQKKQTWNLVLTWSTPSDPALHLSRVKVYIVVKREEPKWLILSEE